MMKTTLKRNRQNRHDLLAVDLVHDFHLKEPSVGLVLCFSRQFEILLQRLQVDLRAPFYANDALSSSDAEEQQRKRDCRGQRGQTLFKCPTRRTYW